MVVNLNMWERNTDGINAWLMDTISCVFDHVYTVDVPATTNCELFASHRDGIQERLRDSLAGIGNVQLQDLMRQISRSLRKYEPGDHIMTDDRAPVELLGIRVIDDLIRQEVSYYRELYDREGIGGIRRVLGL